jgi:DNA topoisomerase-1
VIVESPAKARTVGKFLGRGYLVKASIGHIRDLPANRLGVDVEHDFRPHYVVTPKKREVVKELKELAGNATEIFLATDPDREGEAISWHLKETLARDIAGKPVHRVEFHEITRDAIDRAFANPRAINQQLVDAQQARRVLDRLVGYTISPLLRKKINTKNLSAGRVQSVAVRLVVEREREIQAFVPVEYWSIEAELQKQSSVASSQIKTGWLARLRITRFCFV